MHTLFCSENLKERDHSEDLDMYNIRLDHREIMWESVDWIRLAQDRDQWL
jgi:hypothetical protein